MKYILSLILLSTYLHASAQSTTNIKYRDMSEEIQQLASIMDVNHLSVTLQGDLKGKKIILKENLVSDSIVMTNNILTSYTTMNEDSIIINVMAHQITKDSVRIDIRSKNLFYHRKTYSLPINNHILMETNLDSTPTHNIPICAYTTGISKKFNMNGAVLEAIDYCQLRDSKISPILWKEKFKIDNYYYFTIEIE